MLPHYLGKFEYLTVYNFTAKLLRTDGKKLIHSNYLPETLRTRLYV